jgi:hypothetical protein
MRYAYMILLAVGGLFISGCDPIATKCLTVRIATTSGSQTDPVQVALGRVEATLAGKGMKHVQDDRQVKCYGFSHGVGCKVEITSNKLRLVFWEFGKFRSSKEAIALRNEVKESLATEFGAENVALE